MNRKPMGSRAATVSTDVSVSREEVEAALETGASRLDAAEEKVLRLRYGIPGAHTLVLQQVGQDHPDTRDKLLDIELELMRQLRERQQAQVAEAPVNSAPTEPVVTAAPFNPKRDKIVAALRARKNRR